MTTPAVAYPEPVAVEATVTEWRVSERHDTDMLTGANSTYTDVRARIETVAADGRREAFRVERWFDNSLTIWHETGRGSSSSVGPNGGYQTVEEAVERVKRHAAHAEDPCRRTGWHVLGTDLSATVHQQGYGSDGRTMCGRDMSKGTRVLGSSVPSDRFCGNCTRGY